MTTQPIRNLFSLAFVLTVCCIPLCGQVRSSGNDTVAAEKSAPSRSKSIFENNSIEEMHVRRSLRMAEKQHLEHVDRAREAAKLSADLKQTFLSNKVLDAFDRKKLEKVEKLTRRVRS